MNLKLSDIKQPLSNEDIAELITRRRRQILVHSVLYYRMDTNIIDDHTFDLWSYELVDLQNKYPDIAAKCERHEDFKDFDGSTGAFLPTHEPDVISSAERLLNAVRYLKKRGQIS